MKLALYYNQYIMSEVHRRSHLQTKQSLSICQSWRGWLSSRYSMSILCILLSSEYKVISPFWLRTNHIDCKTRSTPLWQTKSLFPGTMQSPRSARRQRTHIISIYPLLGLSPVLFASTLCDSNSTAANIKFPLSLIQYIWEILYLFDTLYWSLYFFLRPN